MIKMENRSFEGVGFVVLLLLMKKIKELCFEW